MLRMSPTAAERVRERRLRHDPDGRPCARLVRVTGDGCREGTVRIAYVQQPRAGDLVSESEGINLCVSSDVVELLDEMMIDCPSISAGPLFIRAAD